MKAEYLFTKEIVEKRQSQWVFGEKNNDMAYVTGGARSYISSTEDEIHEVIRGYDGLFKDVTCKFSDIKKATKTEDFLFLKSDAHVFCIKLDTVYEGSIDEVTDKVKLFRKDMFKLIKGGKKQESIPKEARDFFRANGKAAEAERKRFKLPLAVRFRPNIIGMFLFMGYNMVAQFDNATFHRMVYSNVAPIFISLLVSGISGFAAGYVYTFFAAWFSQQKESVRVASIILFPITAITFILMAIVGTIPYTIYMLVKGRTSRTFDRIVNISALIFGAIAVVAVTFAASVFLI